jgi:hypothetical protein
MGVALPAVAAASCNHGDDAVSVDTVTGASRHMPSCPTGAFCVAQPASIAADAGAAPAPYTMCPQTVTPPTDAGAPSYAFVSFDPDRTKQTRTSDPRACCYTWTQPCPGGRAYRDDDGVARVAPSTSRRDWCEPRAREAGPRRDATRWEREGAFEHASIATFAQLTLDLLGVGAPAHLVEGAVRAGLDEVKHARIAYALASGPGERDVGPAPLDIARATPRAPSLETLVRETVADGCIGEAAAALALRGEAEATADPALRALLLEMADDEERHAELAYAIVAWALSQDPSLSAIVSEELARARQGVHARVVAEIAEPCFAAL